MNEAWTVHYMNKYPGAMIDSGLRHFKVIHDGKIKVSMFKNGADMWECKSEESVCVERHDLSPIPRDCRVWKLSKEGKILKDEMADERLKISEAVCKHLGKIPSIPEFKKMLNPKFIESSNSDLKWELLPELEKFAKAQIPFAKEISDKLLDAPSDKEVVEVSKELGVGALDSVE